LITVAKANAKDSRLNCVSSPIYHSRFQYLEKALNDLFLKELNSKDSIFISIGPNVVKKIAMFLSGMALRPAAIGVCGETASGKSTIVLDSIKVVERFCREFFLESKSKSVITRLNTDDYYYDRSKEVKAAGSFSEFAKNYDLDTPDAIELSLMKKHIQQLLNNQEVFLPKYDMSGTARRMDNVVSAKPSSIIIAEGLYTLIDGIWDIFDFKIYVDIDKNVQKARFYERAQQRGLGDSAETIFNNASKKAQVYIYPCAKNSDIILNGEVSRDNYKKFISSVLELIESTYYNFAV